MIKYIKSVLMVPSFLFLVTQSAMGSIMRVEVEGIVESIYTGGALTLDGSIQIGSTMKGYALYDSGASDRDAYPNRGDYPVSLIWMEIGNYVFYDGPIASDSSFYITTDNPEPGVRYRVYSFQGKFEGEVYINGVEKRYEDLLWEWVDYTPYNLLLMYLSSNTLSADDSLPLSLPDIGTFKPSRTFDTGFMCIGPGDTGDFRVYGEVTSVRIVPEPATIALLALGGLALLRRKK